MSLHRGKQLDLDKLLEDFTAWQKHNNELETRNRLLALEVETAQELLKIEQNDSSQVRQDIEATQEMVSQLRQTVEKQCNVEDENRNLRLQIDNEKLKKIEAENSHKHKVEEMEQSLMDLQTSHEAEIVHIQDVMKRKADEEKSDLLEVIATKETQIKQLQLQIEEGEKSKQGEILRMRMEFEEKLHKMQKQIVKAQQTNQPSGINQEIFRKKLQFAKSEYERELAEHKKTISELQSRLQSYQRSSTGGSSIKKKKFYT